MKLLWAAALAVIASCSTYRGQNRVQEDLVRFPGGVYEEKSWSETLIFKRNQFYMGATLYYDILSAEMDPASPFMNWLGETKSEALACDKFYIFMIYRDLRRAVPETTVIEQVEAEGGRVQILEDFKRNIRGHYVSDEMHFLGHKVRGVCFKSKRMAKGLEITLPGFEKTDLLQ